MQNPTHSSVPIQTELALRPMTDMQVALNYPCHIVTDEDGRTQIKVEKSKGTKTFDYPYSPVALIKAFQEILVIREEYATKLAAMVITCLSPYRSIAKQLKILANPDNLEFSENLIQQKKSAKAFIAKITELETELKQDLTVNIKTLHEEGGSDLLESITNLGDERRITLAPSFLIHLKQEIAEVKEIAQPHAAFQHFALRVEAVIVHLLDIESKDALVVSDLLAVTKSIVTQTQDPIAGAVFLQTNLHHFSLHANFGDGSTTDLLLSAQNTRHLNNDFTTANLMASEEERPFIARLPLTKEKLNERRCFDYIRSVKGALYQVCEQLDTKLENIWKVFSKLEKQEERKIFLDQITHNPASFILYQLNSANPVIVVQDFIAKHSLRKQYFLDKSSKEIALGNDTHGNASLIDLIALASQRLSANFIKSHNSADNSLGKTLEILSAHPSFLKVFNLLCNQTNKMEVVYDHLFAALKAKDEPRLQGYLAIVEKSKDLASFKKLAEKLKTLATVPTNSDQLFSALSSPQD